MRRGKFGSPAVGPPLASGFYRLTGARIGGGPTWRPVNLISANLAVVPFISSRHRKKKARKKDAARRLLRLVINI